MGKVQVDQPNSELYKLNGWLTVEGQPPCKLTNKNVLLREMTVSGTHRVWGVVIYTGKETKIEKNNETGASTKVSKAMHTLNGFIVWIFISQLILCGICAIGAGVWFAEYGKDSWYLALGDEWSSSFSTNWFGTNNVFLVGVCSFFTFFILLGNMLPISLYVTIDSFIKFFSGFFIGWDGAPDAGNSEKEWGKGMYYKGLEKGAVCRNSNIIEETGQVEIVLSDKTGTLTQNKMQFLKCVIAGQSYGAGVTEVQMAQAQLDGTLDDLMIVHTHALDQAINEVEGVRDYLRALALCHTVQPRENEKDATKVDYSAESPDDGALVMAAANLGFELRTRARLEHGLQELHLKEPESDDVTYRLLDTMDFTPERKRMDVVVQFPEDIETNQVTVICKGADNFVRDACM